MESARTLSRSPHGGARCRVVLDTNAALDLWAFRDVRLERLRQDLHGDRLDVVGCASMREELRLVLDRGVAARHGARQAAVLAEWDGHVRLVGEPTEGGHPLPLHRPCCRDPDDQVFLDLALAQQASWLLTHDRDLLHLRRRASAFGLRILPPHEWPGFAVVQGGLEG